MNLFKPLWLRAQKMCRKATPSRPIESLESRRLFSDGPGLVGETLLGSAQEVTGIVLTFNQHLDPATAQNINAYVIGRHVSSGTSDGGLLGGLGGLFPFVERPGQVDRPDAIVLHPDRRGVHEGRVAFTSAVYDDSTMSVTLTPSYPIKATEFFRYIHVSGTGPTAVTNTLGQAVDGDDNGAPGGTVRVAFKQHQGKTIRYYDDTGNVIQLKLKGPGTIYAFLRTGANPQPIILLSGVYAGKSTFTATIKPVAGNPATTSFQELLGVSNCTATSVTANPAFTIAAVEP